jgi:molecular chaperone GrpE
MAEGKEKDKDKEVSANEAPLPPLQEGNEKELAEAKDRLLRMAAEFDNYKKKMAKDMDASRTMGKAELVKALLPALDEFEMALYALGNSAKSDCNVKGMEMVFSNVLGTLRSAGLREIEAKGKYDPYRHEIVMTRESEEAEGTILEVVRKGYSFNDLMLRPSAVIVSKKTDVLNEKEEENKK